MAVASRSNSGCAVAEPAHTSTAKKAARIPEPETILATARLANCPLGPLSYGISSPLPLGRCVHPGGIDLIRLWGDRRAAELGPLRRRSPCEAPGGRAR